MHEIHPILQSFYISISVLLILLLLCCWIIPDCKLIWIRLWTWMTTRIFSGREEKASLTRSKIYSANGYLVNSESDIRLDCTGSFKRFDSIDRDLGFILASTSLTENDQITKASVVPQESLNKAPLPLNPVKRTKTLPPILKEDNSKKELENVLSLAIPRPKSSMSIAEMASKSNFPISILPPPVCLSTRLQTELNITETKIQVPTSAEQEVSTSTMKRAISCDSVCSDSSVLLGDLEEPHVIGYLCVGLEYDSELSDLIVNVLEAKDLVGPNQDSLINSYVKIYLHPDKLSNAQTRVYKGSNSPSYKERFLFTLHPREQSQKYLCFHVYAMDQSLHVLIGEGEIRLSDISLRQPVTTWVTLTDTGQKTTEFGEIMCSLSYLPTAERLTIVIVKARNLKFQNEESESSLVKVYLVQHGKKIHKKKTSIKKNESSPIFNESMIFNVPAHTLQTIQLRITIAEYVEKNSQELLLGHVIIGAQASGRALTHWNQMLATLRKPVAMWHSLRK